MINILPTLKRENNFALRSSLNFRNGITTLESKNKINADRMIKYDLSGSTSKKTVIGFLRSRIKNIKTMEVRNMLIYGVEKFSLSSPISLNAANFKKRRIHSV